MWETAVQLPEDFDQWDKVASLAKGQSVMGVIGKQMMTVPQISQSLSPEMRLKVTARGGDSFFSFLGSRESMDFS
jgi:hypothetical protein